MTNNILINYMAMKIESWYYLANKTYGVTGTINAIKVVNKPCMTVPVLLVDCTEVIGGVSTRFVYAQSMWDDLSAQTQYDIWSERSGVLIEPTKYEYFGLTA